MIRTLICDDHDLVRTSIARVLQLEPGIEIIGEASNAAALLHRLEAADAPDLLLLDLSLGSGGINAGIDLLKQVLSLHPNVAVLVLSMHSKPDVAALVLQAGARGFVAKGSSIETLLQAIAQVKAGHRYVDPTLLDSLLLNPGVVGQAWDASLSSRERDVMSRLCAGERISDIATVLGLSIKTVSTHKMRLMEKLQVRNNAELIRLGHAHGLT